MDTGVAGLYGVQADGTVHPCGGLAVGHLCVGQQFATWQCNPGWAGSWKWERYRKKWSFWWTSNFDECQFRWISILMNIIKEIIGMNEWWSMDLSKNDGYPKVVFFWYGMIGTTNDWPVNIGYPGFRQTQMGCGGHDSFCCRGSCVCMCIYSRGW